MTPIRSALDVGLNGVKRASDGFDRAAREVATASEPGIDSVSLSGASAPDPVGAIVDLRVQKYAFVANLRVLETVSEVQRDVLDSIQRQRR